jgi:hypothetical protein
VYGLRKLDVGDARVVLQAAEYFPVGGIERNIILL